MCNKKLYQTPLSFSRNFFVQNDTIYFFSITLGFVIPNNSNHCTCQRIFIMYSYVCIMSYFCMRQIFFCHTKHVASVTSHHPKHSTTPHSILPLPYYLFPASPTPPQFTAGQDPPPQVEKRGTPFVADHPLGSSYLPRQVESKGAAGILV
jgi:hypothetical protein